ncbi:MAG: hypothetical protein ACTSU4_13490 [Promethearchaeota archaeon]
MIVIECQKEVSSSQKNKAERIKMLFIKIIKDFTREFPVDLRKKILLYSLYKEIKPQIKHHFTAGKRFYNLILVYILMLLKKQLQCYVNDTDCEEEIVLDWFILHENYYKFFTQHFKRTLKGNYRDYVLEIARNNSFKNFSRTIKLFNSPLPLDRCKLKLKTLKEILPTTIYLKTAEILTDLESKGYSFRGKNVYSILAVTLYFVARKNNMYISEAKACNLFSISSNTFKRRKNEIKQYVLQM